MIIQLLCKIKYIMLARYNSTCKECGEKIEANVDMIEKNEGKWVHEKCKQEVNLKQKKEKHNQQEDEDMKDGTPYGGEVRLTVVVAFTCRCQRGALHPTFGVVCP